MKNNLRSTLFIAAALVLALTAFSGWNVRLQTAAAQTDPTATPTPFGPTPEPSWNDAPPTLRTVSVNATGEVEAQPDVARVRLGVRTEAETASDALDQNNTAMEDLLDALVQSGIDRDDIQTQNVQLYPRYSNQGQQDEQPQVTGYIAVNIVGVRIPDVGTVGDVLDAAVAAGGNTIEAISFEVSETRELLDQARQNAMQEARRKAEQLAELAGATLGPVVSINESGGGQPPIMFGRGEALDVAQSSVPVEPGQQTLSLSVSVTWQLMVADPSSP